MFAAFDSMAGLSQSLLMVTHFAETGVIRRKKFITLPSQVYLSDTREGSFEFLIDVGTWTAGAVASGALWEVIKRAYNRTIGEDDVGEIENRSQRDSARTGDFEALVQAIEPSVRRGHNIVNHGANQINIFVNDHREDSVEFNSDSKDYLLQNIFNEKLRIQRFMITSFDGRGRTGRAFNLELEQAFTFELRDTADNLSLEVIADAARSYALRNLRFSNEIEIACVFDSIDAADGRMKKLRIYIARPDVEQIEGF